MGHLPAITRSQVLYTPGGTTYMFTTGFEYRTLDQEDEGVSTSGFESEL
jgi:hypothetical protein